jgi:O-antigen/teichoic acid export membrane protein
VFQDACRYVFLAQHRPELALSCDAVWAGAQAVAVAALLVRDSSTPALVLATWGFGAAASALFGGVVAGFRWVSPRVWLRLSRRLTGWLLGGGVIGQLQNQAIVMIVAVAAGEVQLAGFRSAQLVTLMPVAALLVAVSSLVVPRLSRSASDGDLSRLSHRTRWLAVRFALGSVPVAVLLMALGSPLLAGLFGERYDDFAPVIVPFAVSIVVLAVTAPLSAGLRALRDGRSLFVAQAAMTLSCLPLTWLGAEVAGARGAAWGVAGAVGVQLVMTATLLRSRLSAAPAAR